MCVSDWEKACRQPWHAWIYHKASPSSLSSSCKCRHEVWDCKLLTEELHDLYQVWSELLIHKFCRLNSFDNSYLSMTSYNYKNITTTFLSFPSHSCSAGYFYLNPVSCTNWNSFIVFSIMSSICQDTFGSKPFRKFWQVPEVCVSSICEKHNHILYFFTCATKKNTE